MTGRITIAAYRTHAENRTQIVLSQTDENGRGHGYRIAGPKHYNSGVTELISADLTARDAAEIRAMLDAMLPVDQSKHRDQVLTEAATATEALRARLWLIEQVLAPIDIQQDPAGIVGMVGPLLDGPLHPTDLAEYRAARTGQEAPAPTAAEPEYVCDVCEDDFCGHCSACTCPACTEVRQISAVTVSAEQPMLAAARARVATLPTANDGQLIAATREQILDAITRTDTQEH
ncbi:hypothetical protein [Kitasatospora cineracea]|uniref:Uncharacterized protein n=1 Tax=Kitasatospora cineracea TaxID=88074 RepID=A0A3N4RQ45_9ACTN|nr:hypothetical protein [Kitasatospora cineracea]RPE34956.1 hypothetical protein EDD38_3299 [Kitasatospora cineracea]